MAQIVDMPIEFKCTTCQSVLRVDETGSGKRARCPHCKSLNLIPKTKAPVPSTPPTSQQFFIDSVSGSIYGPITKLELDQWVQEGRISGDCVVRASGEKVGKPASRYFPGIQRSEVVDEQGTVDIKPNPVVENPYASPPSLEKAKLPKPTGFSITPTAVNFELIFNATTRLFLKNALILSATALVCMLPSIASSIYDLSGNAASAIPQFLLNLVQIYLSIGQTRLAIQISRGQPADFSIVFSGGDKFLPAVFFTFIASIALALGFLAFIIPAILLLLYFWPSFYLLVDGHANVLDSFFMAKDICVPNILTTFLVGLASIGILLVGLVVCGIGVIPASGFVSVFWAISYLSMSGQISFE